MVWINPADLLSVDTLSTVSLHCCHHCIAAKCVCGWDLFTSSHEWGVSSSPWESPCSRYLQLFSTLSFCKEFVGQCALRKYHTHHFKSANHVYRQNVHVFAVYLCSEVVSGQGNKWYYWGNLKTVIWCVGSVLMCQHYLINMFAVSCFS